MSRDLHTCGDYIDTVASLTVRSPSKIVMLVVDGLAGFRSGARLSELTLAATPNLDLLAADGAQGLIDPIGRGITPGSGAGHLGLFGYDPLRYRIGRGVFTAAAAGVDVGPGDVVARANICTLDADGQVADRRAGRMSTAAAEEVCATLCAGLSLGDTQAFLTPETGHRALLRLRGPELGPAVSDTDPQRVGVVPLQPTPKDEGAAKTSKVLTELLAQTRRLLSSRASGNYLLLRGFDTAKEVPSFRARFGMRAVAVVTLPMYRGIARVLGMEARTVPSLADGVDALHDVLAGGADFVYLHFADADTAGEDGDTAAKIAAIEEVDRLLPRIMSAGGDVLVVTGDHATPSQTATHTWHPVPVLLHGGTAPADGLSRFDETSCRSGSLGRFSGIELMPQVLAAAGRIAKFDGQS